MCYRDEGRKKTTSYLCHRLPHGGPKKLDVTWGERERYWAVMMTLVSALGCLFGVVFVDDWVAC